jgi:hypothetical protein
LVGVTREASWTFNQAQVVVFQRFQHPNLNAPSAIDGLFRLVFWEFLSDPWLRKDIGRHAFDNDCQKMQRMHHPTNDQWNVYFEICPCVLYPG